VNTRKLHRYVGLFFAPFFVLTAITGLLLLWRKAEVYGKETKELLLGLHNWELGAKYVGLVLALGLVFMAVSGTVMALQVMRRRR